jgi:hypothetical protein
MRESWPTPAQAIARYRASFPVGRSDPRLSRGSPGTELLATRDARAFEEWLCRAPLLRYDEPSQDGGELRGLVLRGGRGGTGLPNDNPWGLPADVDVEHAVRHLWNPAADGRDRLAYLTAGWVSRDVPDAWFVLDLGWIRDGVGDPTVLQHDPNDGLILSSRQRLRSFLAGHLHEMLDPDS